jgi:hypothetical protein
MSAVGGMKKIKFCHTASAVRKICKQLPGDEPTIKQSGRTMIGWLKNLN